MVPLSTLVFETKVTADEGLRGFFCCVSGMMALRDMDERTENICLLRMGWTVLIL